MLRRAALYYVLSGAWFGTAVFLYAFSSGASRHWPVTLFFSGWIVLGLLWTVEFHTFRRYLARRHPELHHVYVGENWFFNLSHYRLLGLSWNSRGNEDAVLLAHKRSYLALHVIPLVAFASLWISDVFRA